MEIEEGKAISNLKSDPQGAARRRGERRRGRRLLPVTGPQRRGKPSVGRKAGGVNLKVLFFNKKRNSACLFTAASCWLLLKIS